MVTVSSTSFSNIKSDPVRNFKFLVAISHPGFTSANMGFMSVQGLNVTTEVIPYREGGMNTTTQKMPGQTDFAPITLTKGLVVGESAMINWMKELFAVSQGTGGGSTTSNFRANMQIQLLAHPITSTTHIPVKARWKVYNAWPTSISFSDLDAGANALVINQMTLAHEGWDMSIAGTSTSSGLGSNEAKDF